MPLNDDRPAQSDKRLIDPYGRTVDYLRVSVTDRCDLRCVYCMAEEMTFLPKAELLTLEELETLCRRFMAAGVRKIRLTGGEPLVRRNIMQLINNLGAEVKAGVLDELTITTNGTQLEKMAGDLFEAGVSGASTSRWTRSIRKNSTASRDGAILTRCLPGSARAVGRPWCENQRRCPEG